MPVDTSIYGLLDTKGLQSALPNIVNSYYQGRDNQNRLAMLDQQKQLGDVQLQTAQAQLSALPAQQAEAQRKAMGEKAKEMDFHVFKMLDAGMPVNDIIQSTAQKGKELNFTPEQISKALSPFQSIDDPAKLKQHYLEGANPEAYQKQQFAVQKNIPTSPLGELLREREAVAAKDPNSPLIKEYDKRITKENYIQTPASMMVEPPPKAAPGTRVYKDPQGNWQTEILKGSPQWQTQKSKESTDRAFVQNIVPTLDKNATDIENLIKHPGFNNIFGATAAYTPNIFKDTRAAKAQLDQVVGAMETAGMQMQKSTAGSAGAMSEKEWPKMQTYLNLVKQTTDPDEAKRALENAMASYNRMAAVAKESYMNEWGTGQFGDPSVVTRLENKKAPSAHPSDINDLLNKYGAK